MSTQDAAGLYGRSKASADQSFRSLQNATAFVIFPYVKEKPGVANGIVQEVNLYIFGRSFASLPFDVVASNLIRLLKAFQRVGGASRYSRKKAPSGNHPEPWLHLE